MKSTARAVRLASFHGRPAAVAPTRRIGQPARWVQRAVSGGGVPEAGGLWAAAKRAAGTAEGWLRSQAVAGSKQIFLFNLKGKLDRIDEARRVLDSTERQNPAFAADFEGEIRHYFTSGEFADQLLAALERVRE